MRILVLTLFACLGAAIAVAQPAPLPDTAYTIDRTIDQTIDDTIGPTIGHTIPDATLIDDRGNPFRLHSLAGSPVIISPVFTRCPDCAIITSSLRDALAAIDELGSSYHVVTLSVDPADTVPDLAAYRERMQLPAAWMIAIAAAGDFDALLEALNFQVIPFQGRDFAHPHRIAFIDGDMQIAGYVHGTAYEERDIRLALTAAWAGDSLVQKYRNRIAAIAGVSALVTALVVIFTGVRRARVPAA